MPNVPLRPKPAASIVILDQRDDGTPHVLMGRRRASLAFMPNMLVFPGGRYERADRYRETQGSLAASDIRRMGFSGDPAKAAALAVTALREAFEETGLAIGCETSAHPRNPLYPGLMVRPVLDGVRYFARAITPPGQVRRFDTRFFVTTRNRVAAEAPGGPPDPEFSEIKWVPLDAPPYEEMPIITRHILDALKARLAVDPDLTLDDAAIPGFIKRNGRHIIEPQ